SMFGFQRIGDLIWAAGDAQARGFLIGATSGRTTLAGEGLQHQDGHSHLLAYGNPHLYAYDPAFGYEIAVIVREGLRRMLEEGEAAIYYLTVTNEFYGMPAMPENAQEGILKGLYKLKPSAGASGEAKAHLLGSGAILNETLKAQKLLEEQFGVPADVWSVTSYKNLYWDGVEVERYNRLHPGEPARKTFIAEQFFDAEGIFVAASDYLKALPASIAKWIPGPLAALGTDGYGRSETREALRDYFEVDARHIAFAALSLLAREKQIDPSILEKAIQTLEIDPDRKSALTSV
ncbi:MAG: pyruvate dehydrogenase (acetyl-transferring), homodimeric type, partial [Desulfobacterales bacterium]|nr:pyruvate dehydrogenase (acetyl-transferring), homodimeric type [Desulfobacterales bacterium]